MGKTVGVILIVLALIVALAYVFARFVRSQSMFFPARFPLGEWETRTLAVQPENEFFTTPDGVKLHGWLFRSTKSSAPLLLYFHGNGGNLADRGTIAATLATQGVSVFLFDWRGYGRSEGTPSESGLYLDALAAYDHARSAFGSDDITLYGESLGGPYAAYVASKRKARSVIIENSFPSLAELGNALYSPIPLGWTAPWAMRTTSWLNDAGLPVLVIHGKRDQVIPFAMGVRLFEGLRVPKEMLVSETAGHCEIPGAEPARYYEAVVRWATPSSALRAPSPASGRRP